jgi:hypothetical protein
MAPERKTETPAHPTPILLPPRGTDGDPAPLLDTLARVALTIVQRRATKSSEVAVESKEPQTGGGEKLSFTG